MRSPARSTRRALLVVAAVAALALVASVALARPGGGSSYSGGSSHSGGGSGGSDGDGEALVYIIILCFEHPTIGIPLLFLFIGFVYVRNRVRKKWSGSEWSTAAAAASGYAMAAPPPRAAPMRANLAGLRRVDPAFSVVVFEDFLYFLFAELHRARGAGAIDALAAYVGDAARATLRSDGRIAEVTGIIVGSVTYERVDVDFAGNARVVVVVESNYVERYRPQGEARFYAKERLHLSRAAGARSRAPDRARLLCCPNCGGPLSAMRGNQCTYCNTLVPTGSKDWAVVGFETLAREPRGPLLTSNVEERGTNLPTIVDPHAGAAFAQMQAKDPTLTWQTFERRVALVFQELQVGWVGRDPARIRPFVSDNLLQSQLYWIDLYRAARCINRTDGARITRVELASATTDAYFDAITIRLYATGLDYTIGEDGRLLSGSKSKPRVYSEYWTLIRGAQKKHTDKGERQCPNCGAPLSINMAGNCTYCAVKVTSGEYDWVLSRIEQDESYTG